VKVCHPGRLEVIAPRFSFPPPLNEPPRFAFALPLNEPALRLPFAPKDSRPLTLLFTERPPNPFDPLLVRPAVLKKCCEFEGALRNDDGFAARPDGL
jgi:hypothetical protein